MSKNNNDTHCNKLLFEVLERYIRLYNHIEKSIQIASRPGTRLTAQLKISKEAQQLLKDKIENILRENSQSNLNISEKLEHYKTALNYLAELHQKVLIAVPRPHEPIELISYLRQTFLHNPLSNGKKTIPDVFASELLGDQAHGSYTYLINNDDEQLMRDRESILHSGVGLVDFATNHGIDKPTPLNKESDNLDIGYVSLPRIDLGNPCRWPSLLHEAGHFWAEPIDFLDEFTIAIGTEKAKESQQWIKKFSSSTDEDTLCNELTHWLRECWCDTYALTHAGPAVFFAQLHGFLFCNPCYLTEPTKKSSGYPPAWFRLKLILSLSEARFASENEDTKDHLFQTMEQEKNLIFQLYSFEIPTADESLYNLFHYFKQFLRSQFPKDKYTHKTDILPNTLNKLLENLKAGLPIPSIYKEETQDQRPATPDEILLAGWLYRCGSYKDDFLEAIEKSMKEESNIDELIKALKEKADRADECLKRSIQMAEWFGILNKNNESRSLDKPINLSADNKPLAGLLSDVDINALVHEKNSEKSLKIVPLLDARKQIAGSVVDIRLGHNFEIFFSYAKGIIDPLSRVDGGGDKEIDSMEVDIDFLRSISIVPGQFILGHTLEYIKLPNDIAAQIEGRSSFARVGLQVHMTANLVEAGFQGCLTLEITNSGHSTITLYPGMRIAQLRFFRLVTPPDHPYSETTNKYSGMLSHNKTRQFSDWEVEAFQNAKDRLGLK